MKTPIRVVVFLLVILLAGCGGYQYLEKPYMPPETQKAIASQETSISDKSNPCNDSTYLKLKAKPLEQLSDREFEMLKIREKACNDYQARVQAGAQVEESLSGVKTAVNAYYWIAGISTVGLLIYLFSR